MNGRRWLAIALALLLAAPAVKAETGADDPEFDAEVEALPLATPKPRRTRRSTGLEARRKLNSAGRAVKDGFERAGAAVEGAVQSTKEGLATILESTGETLRSAGKRVAGEPPEDRPPATEEETPETFDEGIQLRETPSPSPTAPDPIHKPLQERDLE